jgi:predicted DNA repair protein MutK
MIPIALAHIQFAPGFIINLAHLGHASLCFLCRDKAFRALVLELG